MDVPVCLLATEAEDVEPFGWHDATDRFAYAVNNPLKLDVLAEVEVARNVLAVLLWGHEDVPVQRWVAVQEGDGLAVFVDDVVLIVGVAREHLANEALPPSLSCTASKIDAFPPESHDRHILGTGRAFRASRNCECQTHRLGERSLA